MPVTPAGIPSPMSNTVSFIDVFNNQINQEIDDRLQGDAVYSNARAADQRVLKARSPNFYFVRKEDFNSPNHAAATGSATHLLF